MRIRRLTKKEFVDTECGKKLKNSEDSILENNTDKSVNVVELCNFLRQFIALDYCKPCLKLSASDCPNKETFAKHFSFESNDLVAK